MEEARLTWNKGDAATCREQLKAMLEQDPLHSAAAHNLCVVDCHVGDPVSQEKCLEALEGIEGSCLSEKTHGLMQYNKAVLKILKGETTEAISLLLPLSEDLSVLDDGCATSVCLLLTEMHLRNDDPLSCHSAMQSLEHLFSSDPLLRPIDWDASEDVHHDAWVGTDDPVEQQGIPQHELAFPSISKLDWDEGDASADASTVSNGTHVETPSNLGDVKALVHLYRARVLAAMGRFRDAQSQLRCLSPLYSHCISVLFLKGYIHWTEGQYNRAQSILDQCINTSLGNSEFRHCILSDAGILQTKFNKPNLASLLLNEALTCIPDSMRAETIYQLGLMSFQRGSYAAALSQFIEAVRSLHSEPNIWIRMAECCIALWNASQEEPEMKMEHVEISDGQPVLTILPSLSHSNEGHPSGNTSHSCLELLCDVTDDPLEQAYVYLQNALALLGPHASLPCRWTSMDINAVRRNVYLKLAFVNLSMQRPERCLYCLGKLKTDMQQLNGEISYCMCMYEVEALCLLDRPSEAAEILKSHVDSQEATVHAVAIPSSEEYQQDQKRMYQDLASVYGSMLDTIHARHYLQKALLIDPTCKKSVMLMIYMELVMGNKTGALDIIRNQSL